MQIAEIENEHLRSHIFHLLFHIHWCYPHQ